MVDVNLYKGLQQHSLKNITVIEVPPHQKGKNSIFLCKPEIFGILNYKTKTCAYCNEEKKYKTDYLIDHYQFTCLTLAFDIRCQAFFATDTKAGEVRKQNP